MAEPGSRARIAMMLVTMVAALGRAGPLAASADSGIDTALRTPLPYWQVGAVDADLSRRCSLGTFNQRVMYRYAGRFTGLSGAALVGAAKGTGLNLFDPGGKAEPGFDYWFYRDRTSNCIVFKARVKASAAP